MRYEKREKATVYYNARKSTSGLSDVLLNVYYPDGTKFLEDKSMTEIGSTGIYKFTFLTPPNDTTLFAVMDSATTPFKSTHTIAVGRLHRGGGFVQRPVMVFTKEEKDKIIQAIDFIDSKLRNPDNKMMDALMKLKGEVGKLLLAEEKNSRSIQKIFGSMKDKIEKVQINLSDAKRVIKLNQSKSISLEQLKTEFKRLQSVENKIEDLNKEIVEFEEIFLRSVSAEKLEELNAAG